MARIFISYRREDSSGYTGRLHDRLSASFGHDLIFRDIDTIKPGEDFIEAMKRGAESSDVMIAVIGKQWLSICDDKGMRRLDNPEDPVRLEVATAFAKNIRVIPVLVQGAAMPNAQDLPEDLMKLTRRNAIEISDARWDYDVARLIETIQKMSGLSPPFFTAKRVGLSFLVLVVVLIVFVIFIDFQPVLFESVIGNYECVSDSKTFPKCHIFSTPGGKLAISFVGPTHSDPSLIDQYRGPLDETSNGFIAKITNEFRPDPSSDIKTSNSRIELSRYSPSKLTGVWKFDGTSRPFEMVKTGNRS